VSKEIIHQQDGPDVHVWTSGDDLWACAAADHGPLCRLCQRVDEVLDGLLENVREGNMIVRVGGDGQMKFSLTEQGNARSEEMIHTDPEAAALYAQVSTAHGDVKLNPSAVKVLEVLYEVKDDPDGLNVATLVERTGLTRGQVDQAIATLESLGFIG
jgi:hypothetical protein